MTVVAEIERVCCRCGEARPISNFARFTNKQGRVYRRRVCGRCSGPPPRSEGWMRKYQREYYHGKGRVEESRRRYRENPAPTIRRAERRRAIRRGLTEHYTTAEWLALVEEYSHICLACGTPDSECTLVPDHVIPLSLGGSDLIENIQQLDGPCNQSKYIETWDFRYDRCSG